MKLEVIDGSSNSLILKEIKW